MKSKYKFEFLYYIPVVLLLIFPEHSLQTSAHLDKTTCHSIYLCKIFLGLGVADWIIVSMLFLIFLKISFNRFKMNIDKNSSFYILVLVHVLYLIIGIFYNLIIQTHIPSYLYDLKVVLYFVTIYLWFKLFIKIRWNGRHIFYFFIIYALGNIWDFIYVYNFGVNQRPNELSFLPTVLPLFDLSFLIMTFYCFKRCKFLITILILFEILSAINKANLGVLLGGVTTIIYIIIYELKLSTKNHFLIIFISFILLSVFLPLILYDLYPLIWEIKADGLDIRQKNTLSLLDNFFSNFSVVIGKGFGSTYFETYHSQYSNIYSTGIYHQEGDIKFMMQTPIAIFYKLGLLGSSIVLFVLIKTSLQLLKISKFENNFFFKFLTLIYPVFMFTSMISPGILQYSVMLGIILFISDEKIYNFIKNNN
jgi:hypothetical protein